MAAILAVLGLTVVAEKISLRSSKTLRAGSLLAVGMVEMSNSVSSGSDPVMFIEAEVVFEWVDDAEGELTEAVDAAG